MPKLRKLRAVQAVAEEGRVAAAARSLNVSQPAITRAVQSLEEKLGVPLFHRSPHGLTCTEAGTALTKRINRALGQLRTAEHSLSSMQASPCSNALCLHAADHEFSAIIAVGERGTISAAARSMGLSQAALNRSLRALECRLNQPLFHRTNEGMRPTPIGELILLRVNLALREIRQGVEEVEMLKGAPGGVLRIGALPMTRERLVPFSVDNLLRRFTQASISIIDGAYNTILQKMRYGDIDVIVGTIRQPPPVDDIQSEELFTDGVVVVARADHPFTRLRNLRFGDGLDLGWVLPFKGVPLRTHFERALQGAGFELPKQIIETDSMATVRSLLMKSDRLAVLSYHQVYHETEFGMLKILPMPIPSIVRPVGLTFRKDYVPTPLSRAFFEEVRKTAAEIGDKKAAA